MTTATPIEDFAPRIEALHIWRASSFHPERYQQVADHFWFPRGLAAVRNSID